jgi:type II secretory pathway pseudopilin PulG
MIATLVFSIILIVITAGIIQFTNQYYRGVTATNTQSVARAISDAVTQDIQFSSSDPTTTRPSDITDPNHAVPGQPYGFCAGGHLYSYQVGKQIKDNPTGSDQVAHALVEDAGDVSAFCGTAIPTPESLSSLNTTEHELLEPNMRLAKFEVSQISNTQLYKVTVRVIYGDFDVLINPSDPNATCKPGTGSQFCATSELTTTVEKRL